MNNERLITKAVGAYCIRLIVFYFRAYAIRPYSGNIIQERVKKKIKKVSLLSPLSLFAANLLMIKDIFG